MDKDSPPAMSLFKRQIPSGGGTSTTIDVEQVAHGLAVGDVVRLSGANTYTKARANSAANAEVVGIVSEVTDADNFSFTTIGLIEDGVPAVAAGTVLFLDPTTAGALTTTEPTTAGQVSKPLLIVIENATSAIFLNLRGAVIGAGSGGGGGSTIPAFAQKSANYTITADDHTLEATANTFTFTLPPVASCTAGQFFYLINSGTGVVTIDGDGSETINGDLTVDMYQYDSVILVCNGTGWAAWV